MAVDKVVVSLLMEKKNDRRTGNSTFILKS